MLAVRLVRLKVWFKESAVLSRMFASEGEAVSYFTLPVADSFVVHEMVALPAVMAVAVRLAMVGAVVSGATSVLNERSVEVEVFPDASVAMIT